jgi:hypothetical protein
MLTKIRVYYISFKVGGIAFAMFQYRLPDGSLFNNDLFCRGIF